MKNIFKISFCAVALAICGCSMQDNYEPQGETVKITLSASSPETKTYFGEKNESNKYPTLWSETDRVYVSINANGDSYGLSSPAVVSNGGKNATFDVNLTTPSAEEYILYAYSPKDSYSEDNKVNTGGAYNTVTGGKIRLWIPKVQTPTATSVDPHAQLIFGKSETLTELGDKSVDMTFTHWTAYGKMSLTGLALDEGDAIKSVTLTSEGEHWLSGGYVHKSSDGLVETTSTTKDLSLTINTASSTDIWFSCFAGVEGTNDLSDTKLTVVVSTENSATYTRELDLTGKALKFVAGQVSNFSVDMSTATVEKPVTGKRLEVYVDFGTGSKYNSELPWNNYSSAAPGASLQLNNPDGELTAVTIETTAQFTQSYEGPSGEPNEVLTSKGIEWPLSAWRDALLIKGTKNTGDTPAAAVTLSGLDPSKTYTLTVLSQRYNSSIGARKTRLTVKGATALEPVEFDCGIKEATDGTGYTSWENVPYDNYTAQFLITPDSNGKIEISVVGIDTTKAADGLLNALHIIENE